MIDRLRELAYVVSKNKVKRIEIVGEANTTNTLVGQLYEGIQSGEYKTEESAALSLYEDNPENLNYKQLKYNLEKRLYNTLFHIDVNDSYYSDSGKAYYTCYKNFATVMILVGKTARKSAVSLAERTLRIAIKFEFTAISIELLKILKAHYSTYDKNKKAYRIYADLYRNQKAIYNAEAIVESYYQEFALFYIANKSISKEGIKFIRDIFGEIEALMQTYSSYRLHLVSNIMFSMYYEAMKEYQKLITLCNNAIVFFESKPNQSLQFPIYLNRKKLGVVYTTLKEYEKARKEFLISLNYTEEGGKNWFIILGSLCTLCFYSKKHNEALEILLKAKNHKGFKNLYPKDKEIWEIYTAYIHYFIRLGKINPTPEGAVLLDKFRLQKFLNSVPFYSKDKRGLNIAILSLQLMFFLEEEKYEKVIKCANALEQYSYKYLKKDDTYRSSCFIKMLTILPKANFHKTAVIRKTKSYLEKLRKSDSTIERQSSEIEIVPYEDLWELVILSLDDKFQFQRKRSREKEEVV